LSLNDRNAYIQRDGGRSSLFFDKEKSGKRRRE
jgi:hypothetical protein